jgi:hypothetical protein
MYLQRFQNRVLRVIGSLPKRTPIRIMHKKFHIQYVYDFITDICEKQAEVIQNHENKDISNIGRGVAQHRKHKRLKLAGGQV